MEIQTKLLIADGDIVVIGGIKKNIVTDQLDTVPGLNKVPVLGKMFSGKSKEDDLTELIGVYSTKGALIVMLKISRESEINLINVLIDNDVISGKDLISIKK